MKNIQADSEWAIPIPGVRLILLFHTVRRKSYDLTKRKPAEAGLLETETARAAM
jgi:hypothetical protein